MKLSCDEQILAKALGTVQKAVSARTTLPILRGILLEAKGEELVLSATDLDMTIVRSIPAKVEKEGAVVLTSRLFGDIIRKLPAGEILIEMKEDGNVLIKNAFSEFNLLGQPKDEFPSISDSDPEVYEIAIGRNDLAEIIRKTAFAASVDESKGIIVGSLMEIEDGRMNMVALDGFRMSIARAKVESRENKNIIVAARLLSELGRIAGESEDEELKVLIGDKKMSVLFKDTKVSLRLMDGEYIKYKDILPKEHRTTVTVGKSELLACIERASLFAKEGKNNLIRIMTGASIMTISSRSDDGNVREEVMVEREGMDLEIGFNSKYIMDVLKTIDDDRIRMEFNTNVSPCMIKPVSGDEYEHLVLPVRI